MQELQPEMKKLKEKYKDDAKKQQEETMKLFQSNGVNPLAGCFPIIVQMPILIALYQAIMRNDHIREHTFVDEFRTARSLLHSSDHCRGNNIRPTNVYVFSNESTNEKLTIHFPGNDFRDVHEFRSCAATLLDLR